MTFAVSPVPAVFHCACFQHIRYRHFSPCCSYPNIKILSYGMSLEAAVGGIHVAGSPDDVQFAGMPSLTQ